MAKTVASLFERRFSCREFERQELTSEQIHALLEAARWAPSAGGIQPWRFVAVRDATLRRDLARAAFDQEFVARAPLVIVVCALADESAKHYGRRGRELYCLQDTAAAIENILLAATSLGLGSCWVGAFGEDAASRVLGLPAGWRPVAILPVGHPSSRPPIRSRRPLEEVVVWR